MSWDYWFYWLMSAVWVIVAGEAVVKYVKTKQKWPLAKAIFYLLGAAFFAWIGDYNRERHVRDAEHELQDRISAAKSKMMRVEFKQHTPEEAADAVMTFVTDLRDENLAPILSSSSSEFRFAWREYVRSCLEMADELKALGAAAPTTLWWMNDPEAPPPENLPNRLRVKMKAIQNAEAALKELANPENEVAGAPAAKSTR